MQARSLTALILRLLHGRVGSSLLMRLLATSSQVISDPVPPHERRLLAFSGVAGRFPSDFSPASDADLNDLSLRGYAQAWRRLSAILAPPPGSPARFYCEKGIDNLNMIAAAGIPISIIDIVRDPRDIYVSARAFARRAGRRLFGIDPSLPDIVNLSFFLADIATRAEAISRKVNETVPLLIRYEDMVHDMPNVVAQLKAAFGLTLSPELVTEPGSHMTSRDVLDSVGRWKRELEPEFAELMTHMLDQQLRRFRYTLD
jgi:hypothetical protein